MTPILVRCACAVMLSAVFAVGANAKPLGARDDFNLQASKTCVSKHLGQIPAGQVAGLQEDFYSTLTAAETRSFTGAIPRVDGGPKACAKLDGISCPAAWNMIALRKASLLPRFVRYACSHVKSAG